MSYKAGDLVFEDWRIVSEIGSGASGKVYEIRKGVQGSELAAALKVVHVPQDPGMIESLRGDGMDDEEIHDYLKNMVEELIGEIKIMVSMKGAPHMVSCEDYKVIEQGDLSWTVLIRMELLTPLNRYIAEHDITEADVYRLAGHMAGALAVFEERDIIHRDIKPENIFINSYDEFKLGDFGIARVCDGTQKVLSMKGTENYMAPEVYKSGGYDHTVDLYSLGLVLYKMLNHNRLPFYPVSGSYTLIQSQQARMERLSGKKEIPAPELASPEFARIILKMCAFSVQDRYGSVGEMMKDLASFAPGDTIVSHGREEKEDANRKQGTVIDEDQINYTHHVFHAASQKESVSSRQLHEHVNRSKEQEKPDENKADNNIESNPANPASDSGSERLKKEKITNEASTARPSSAREKEMIRKREQQNRKGSRKILYTAAAVLIILAALLFSYLRSAKYDLKVTGGSGTGEYKSGTSVTVKAEEQAGKAFAGWQVSGIKLSENELAEESITFSMPRKNVTLTASYDTISYVLTVNGGSGSGEYEYDEEITVEAEDAEEGYLFKNWELISGAISIDTTKSKVSFRMPEADVELTALYEEETYEMEVSGASGSGSYAFGEKITLEAEEKSGSAFLGWTFEGEALPDLTEEELASQKIRFAMPAGDLIVTAEYEANEHTAAITGGSGSGTYKVGETVEIIADPSEEGYEFGGWKLLKGRPSLEDSSLERTYFVMPDQDVEIEALSSAISYTVSVTNGNGGGTYHFGDTVTISANTSKDGMTFSSWSVDSGTLTLADPTAQNISFRMPAENVTVSAHYSATKYTVKLTGGQGSGMYAAGDEVTIRANQIDSSGNTFASWSLTGGSLDVSNIDLTQAEVTFVMPESNLTFTALYASKAVSAQYALTVNGGSGSGYYSPGEKVTITADAPKAGMKFLSWFVVNYAGNEDFTKDTITITMPESDIVITAMYGEE